MERLRDSAKTRVLLSKTSLLLLALSLPRAGRFIVDIKVKVKDLKWLLIFSLAFSNSALAAELKPFNSDGCSAFPDGTQQQNELWLNCCTAHDYAYWKGGTYQERIEADTALKECVSEVGEKEIALLMLAGVRVGGTPLLPTPFRWGYGWPYPRFYGELTKSELEQVNDITK